MSTKQLQPSPFIYQRKCTVVSVSTPTDTVDGGCATRSTIYRFSDLCINYPNMLTLHYTEKILDFQRERKNRDTQRPGFLGDKKIDWNCSKRLSIIVQWNSNNHDFFIFFFWCCCCFFSPNQLIETRFSSRGYSSDIPSSYFIRLSKVWIMLHKGSVARVQNEM